jgi:hypothetical protein
MKFWATRSLSGGTSCFFETAEQFDIPKAVLPELCQQGGAGLGSVAELELEELVQIFWELTLQCTFKNI